MPAKNDKYAYLKGGVLEANIRKVQIRLDAEDDVKVGEMYAVENKHHDRLFLVGIVDVRDGQESRDASFAARMVANQYRQSVRDSENRDQGEDQAYPDPIERGIYDVGEAKILGYWDPKRQKFSKPNSKPSRFSFVRRLVEDDLKFLDPFRGQIRFAKIRSGDTMLEYEVGLDPKDLTLPCIIGAPTGSGKSTLNKRMLAATAEHGETVAIAFDRHNELWNGEGSFKGLADHPLRDRFVLFSNDQDKTDPRRRPIRFAIQDIRFEDIMSLRKWTEPQIAALENARAVFGADWLLRLAELEIGDSEERKSPRAGARRPDSEEDLGFEDDPAPLPKRDTLLSYLPNDQAVTLRKVQNEIRGLLRKEWISKDRRDSVLKEFFSLSDTPGTVIVFDLNSLDSVWDGNTVINLVCSKLLAYNQQQAGKPKAVSKFPRMPIKTVVIEEGNLFVASRRESSSNIISRYAYEGRKYKLNWRLICQSIKELDNSMLSQAQVHFIGGITDPSDRRRFIESAKQPIADQDNAIQAADTHEWLFTKPGLPFALPIKVEPLDVHLERMGNIRPSGIASFFGDDEDADDTRDEALDETPVAIVSADEDDDDLAY